MSTALPVIEQFESPPFEHQLAEVKPGLGQVSVTFVRGEPKIATHLLLGCVRHPALRVVEPIDVHFALEDGSVRAEAGGVDEFGFGPTYGDALRDLQHALAELYLTLEVDQERLGPDLAHVWSVLQTKLQHRDVHPAA